MHIYPKQKPLNLLLTVCHESLHACFPDLDNDAVDEFDKDFGELLRRMNIKVEFDEQ